jgi:hypothetical protein
MDGVTEARKAYCVEISGRFVDTVLVYANSGAEAAQIVASGGGEAVDSRAMRASKGNARRAPKEDREPSPDERPRSTQ